MHYFHVVFTQPSELRGVTMRHREAVFDMLFASASATLLELARDPKRLGAELGVTYGAAHLVRTLCVTARPPA